MVPNICIMETASGEKTKSEAYGIGDHDFVPWQIGAVMLYSTYSN
jgi:altronate hydrolase